jgi:hypothetical protein
VAGSAAVSAIARCPPNKSRSSPRTYPQSTSVDRPLLPCDSSRFAARQPSIAHPEQARHDKKQDQDRRAVQCHHARAALTKIKKEVGIPAGDPTHNQGVDQPRSRQIIPNKTTRMLIRRRGPNTSQPSTASVGTMMWTSVSEAHSKPRNWSSGCNKNQCTRPVIVMPVSALSRATLQPEPSRPALRARLSEVTTTNRLAWAVK